MLKKSLLIISLTSFLSMAHAESCPTINDLKHNNLHNWTLYDIDNGTPIVDPKEITDYEYNASTFALAEWAKDAPEGEAHCYYFNQTPNQGYGIAYLAKTSLINASSFVWRNGKNQQCTTKDDNCQCQAGDEACTFIAN